MNKGCVIAMVSLLLGCGQPSEAPSRPQAMPEQNAKPVDTSGERLLAQPPINWQQVFRSDRPGGRLVEYVPDDAAAGDWSEKLAFESFTADQFPLPQDLIGQIGADQEATCEKLTNTQTFAGDENGYATAVHLLVCFVNKLTNQGQVSLIKAIRGDGHFYVITMAARTQPMELDNELPLPPELVAQWAAYLGAIRVCNPDAPAHPCPAGGAGVEPLEALGS
ncbi:MAG: hypothetical protein HC809_10740 [Gammaproteobacteria bacterium]|nr:hypothetical protein [Gammaproteobacteria bacterium]